MDTVCNTDRFFGDSVLVNLFERITCTSSRLLSKDELINSPLTDNPEMIEIPVRDFINLGARHIENLKKIRAITDKDERDQMKCDLLPAASISCTLFTRDGNVPLEDRIKNYSGLIALDFDNVPDVEEAKLRVSMLPYVWYCGLSASGRGFYALVPTDNRDYLKHRLYFAALTEEMKKMGLEVDQKCKDEARLRFVSFDVHGYFNDGCDYYRLPEGFTLEEPVKQRVFVPLDPAAADDDRLNDYANEWIRVGAVLDDYGDWFYACMALSTIGERGWQILEIISELSTHYNQRKNRKLFEQCARSNRSITIATFYYICHKYNVRPPRFDAPRYDVADIPEVPAGELDPEEFLNEAEAAVAAEIADGVDDGLHDADEEPVFPAYVFPDAVQEIVDKAHYGMNFPMDYIGSSLIVAAGAAVGNSIQVQVLSTWIEKPVIYMAIVGEPGTNKSAPLEFAIKPLEERDDKEMEKYDKLWAQFEKECANAAGGKGVMPTPPDYLQIVLNDFTMEAMMQQHAVNKRGMLVYKDELINFIRNMGRYSSGNDEMTWTSMFNGGAIQNTRKDKRKTKLKNTCVSICGTIQPASLGEFSKGRTDNGFVDRWLFAYPKTPDAPKFKKGCLMPEIITTWHDIMEKILNLKYDEKTAPIKLSEAAEDKFSVWYNELADRKKGASNVFRMMSTKMERYCIRLAIVLDAMRYGCDGKKVKEISEWAIEGAIALVDYYLRCGMKARRHFRLDPLSNLSILQKRIYKALPMSFETGDGVQVAQEHGMSERTFKYWLHSDYFLLTSRGHYEKRFR